jgi:hypothetical protein
MHILKAFEDPTSRYTRVDVYDFHRLFVSFKTYYLRTQKNGGKITMSVCSILDLRRI